MPDTPASNSPFVSYTQKVLIAVLIAIAAVAALLALRYFADILLISFAAVLLAVGWRGLAELLCRHAPWSANAVIVVVIGGCFILCLGGGWWIAPNLINGIEELYQRFPAAVSRIEEALAAYPSVEQSFTKLMQNTDADTLTAGVMNRLNQLLSSALGVVSTSLSGLVGLVVVLALAIYFASNPQLYLAGALKMLPPARRPRIDALAQDIAHGLRWWMLGRLASMTIVGLLTWAGLLLLDVPSALMLAFIAGLLSFIPNIGPVLSAVPAVLVGLSQSPMMALYVALLYVIIQTVESYLITPMIQRQAIAMPPALIIFAQLLFGVAFGFLGLLLATPLALIVIIVIQQLYLHDYYGEQVK